MHTTNIAILLLAAGGSTRFGSPKQLLPYKGKPLIQHLAETALHSKASATYVVLGAATEKIRPVLSGLSAQIILNDQWQEGIGSSIRVGINTFSKEVDAALIMLCDQPLATSEILNRIIEAHQTSTKPIIASEYANTLGVPALFAKSLFPELLNLQGDRGAKQIIQSYSNDVASVPFPGGAVDINTVDDLKLLS